MKAWIPPEEYFKGLPKKWMGPGVLFFNQEGKFLIVNPTYKDYWEIVGGTVDTDESPIQTAVREVKEETGFDITSPALLCFDYHANDGRGDRFHFVFDGGVLTEEQIASIVLQADELSEWRFVTFEEAKGMLHDKILRRVAAALTGKEEGRIVYAEYL